MQNDLFSVMQHFYFTELCMRMEAKSLNQKRKTKKNKDHIVKRLSIPNVDVKKY